jgi:hypothetical protein
VGFGCGCFDRCDACVGGYGDGPCGGYYSFWDRYGCFPGFGCGGFGFPGFRSGKCGCFPRFGFPFRGCGCGRPFGLCFNIPFGCGSLGIFL